MQKTEVILIRNNIFCDSCTVQLSPPGKALMCITLPGPAWGWLRVLGDAAPRPAGTLQARSFLLWAARPLWSTPTHRGWPGTCARADGDPKELFPSHTRGHGETRGTRGGVPAFISLALGYPGGSPCPEPGQDYTVGSAAFSVPAAGNFPGFQGLIQEST